MNAIAHEQVLLYAPQAFQGLIISTKDIKHYDLSNKRVAIIGTDQFSVRYLLALTETARQLYIFQTQPRLILPHNSRIASTLVPHPRIARNRPLFSQSVKRVLALRFLEREVNDLWLRRLLTANAAAAQLHFLKSDSYYQALQKANCQLITWPIAQINTDEIITLHEQRYEIDVLIYANDEN